MELMKIDLRKITSLDDVVAGETVVVINELVLRTGRDERGRGQIFTIVRGGEDRIIEKEYKLYKDGGVEQYSLALITPALPEYIEYNQKLKEMEHENERI